MKALLSVLLAAAAIITLLPLLPSLVLVVYAGGPEWDCLGDEYSKQGSCECWHDGWIDGLNHPFDQKRFKECDFQPPGFYGNQYYLGFIAGCRDGAGNGQDVCENFTDK
ncbi:MAG TPA: hypothetical protein VE130_14265 [Nitrososphaeraceae archaeon]|jgi:hypothetical protein|nr:hypothetical protein [Nitrososphaeraceae archaeon]